MLRSALSVTVAVLTLFAAVGRSQVGDAPPALPGIAVGGPGALVVNDQGLVTYLSRARAGQRAGISTLELPRKAVQAAATYESAFVLLDDGTVMGWGSAIDVPAPSQPSVPDLPAGLPPPALRPRPLIGLSDVVQIDANANHGVALRRDGTVLAWGNAQFGHRGYGDARPKLTAVSVVPGVSDIVQVDTALEHTLALSRDGRVFAWGFDGNGALGSGALGGPRAAAVVEGLTDVVAISAGLNASFALQRDGALFAWGSNTSAMIGNGQRPGAPAEPGGTVPTPSRVALPGKVTQIAAGEGHAIALLADGTMWAWGFDGYGQVGVGGGGQYQLKPVAIKAPARVRRVLATGYHSFAVDADGRMWRWGGGLPPGRLEGDVQRRPVPFAAGQ